MAGGLTGTLSGLDASTLSEALRKNFEDELAAQTKAQVGAAQQAQQSYQAAQQQPAPELNPFEQLIPALLGNVASVLSQNPAYQKQGAEQVQQSRSELLQARIANIKSLQDIWQQKAEAAQKAGDLETAEKSRMRIAQHDKLLEQLNTAQEHANKLDEQSQRQKDELAQIAARGAQDRLTQAQKDKAETSAITAVGESVFPSTVSTTGQGRQFLDLTNIKGTKETQAALKWAADNKIPAIAAPAVERLKRIQTARDNIETMLGQAESILPADPQERVAKFGNRKLSKILQTDEQRAAFGTWRISAIQQLTALAGGLGSGLRINKAEIEAAMQNDIPTLNDTYGVALQKANNVRAMLDHTEGPIIESDWRKMQNGGSGQSSAQSPKAMALVAARTGNIEEARRIVQAHPELDNDPDLIKLARRKKR